MDVASMVVEVVATVGGGISHFSRGGLLVLQSWSL